MLIQSLTAIWNNPLSDWLTDTYSDHGSGRSSRKPTTLSRWWDAKRQTTCTDALNAIWTRVNLDVFVNRLVNTSSTCSRHSSVLLSPALCLVTALSFFLSHMHAEFSSVLWHCWSGDRKGIRPVKSWVLVCWWWQSHRSFARLINAVVTTTYGTIWPICAESAVKPQPTNLSTPLPSSLR